MSRKRTNRFKTKHGYIKIYLDTNDPFYSMAETNGYAYEHRIVIARQLNRCLQAHEGIHHRNGIRDDNRPDNLELVTKVIHYGKVICPYCNQSFIIR